MKIVKDLQQTLKSKTKFHQIVFDSQPSNENTERASLNQSKQSIFVPDSRAPTSDSNFAVQDENSSSFEEDINAQMPAPQLKFDSDFESGNLRCAVRVIFLIVIYCSLLNTNL